jgi:DNA-binding beta-propeller fold protein YncE
MIAGALGAAPASGQTETATAFGLAQYPRNDLAVGYEVDALWPRRPLRHPWGEVSGVAVDRWGRIWSLDRGDVPVQVFDREGQLLQAWGQGRFRRPHQIELDRQGNVWVVDAGAHVVSKFTAEGKPLLTLGTPGTPGDDNRHFNQPTDLAITPQGHLFVSDGYGNNRVVHFDADGRYVHSWGYLGSGPGQFSLPHAIAIDSRGQLYVADRNNARVQVFDQRGAFLAQWCNLVVPWHIEIARDDSV